MSINLSQLTQLSDYLEEDVMFIKQNVAQGRRAEVLEHITRANTHLRHLMSCLINEDSFSNVRDEYLKTIHQLDDTLDLLPEENVGTTKGKVVIKKGSNNGK